jgi:signal transduction histidine kinase
MSFPEAPIDILGDPNRIHQICVNLLSNAARYTPDGGLVSISVGSEGKEAIIRVSDNGIGLPPDQLMNIFDLFTQAHPNYQGTEAGLGIGLALTRELVALHEGTIQAVSEGVGKGIEFIVRFPLLFSPPNGANR